MKPPSKKERDRKRRWEAYHSPLGIEIHDKKGRRKTPLPPKEKKGR